MPLQKSDPVFDRFLVAGAVDERRVFFLDDHFLDAPEHVDRHFLKLDAELFADELSASEDRDIFEHRFAAVAKAGRLNGDDFQASAEAVNDECRKRFAFDIFSEDDEAAFPTRQLLGE